MTPQFIEKACNLLYGDSPFVARRTIDKTAHEVIEQTNADWREIISDDVQHHGYFETYAEASKHADRLRVEWAFKKLGLSQVEALLSTTPGAPEPDWAKCLRKLAFAARTTGGTAGRDSGLMQACAEAEAEAEALLARAPAAPVAAVPERLQIAAGKWDSLTEQAIDSYLDDYEMRGIDEQGCDGIYTPTEGERALIKDAVMGLLAEIDSAYPTPPVQADVLHWAVDRWKAEVKDRPLVNKNRRPLDDAWRQVVRFAGGDPDALLGPSHDNLTAAQAEGGRRDGPTALET